MGAAKIYPEVSASTARTISNRYVDLLHPDWREIALYDVAYQMGSLNRWSGARHRQISVLEHSLACAAIAPPWLKLPALLHDGHEFLTGDITRPMLKAIETMAGVHCARLIEAIKFNLDVAIARRLFADCGVPEPANQESDAWELARLMREPPIKAIDNEILRAEAADDCAPAEVKLRHRLVIDWLDQAQVECRARFAPK